MPPNPPCPPHPPADPTRRRALGTAAAALAVGAGGWCGPATAQATALATRRIPSSGIALPMVGLGTWITFNVGSSRSGLDESTAVMRAFFAGGGRLVDSSPMYGSAQSTVGHALRQLAGAPVFSADKVWVSPGDRGPAQIETSRQRWGVPRFDLLQVHNLLAWEEHLPKLFAMKAAGQVRHVGITTSEGRRHAEFEQVMRTQPLDFIQLTYNPVDREAEQRLLPLAQARGIGVIVNRPFQQGDLLQALQRHRLPAWAAELGCDGWAQLVLKFILSHPAVTCVIPATTSVAHVRQNLAAAQGVLPDAATRQRIAAEVQGLLR